MRSKVLVTGASGFVGRAVVAELGGAGFEVVSLARSASAGVAIRGDVRDPAVLDAAFAHRPTAVVHLVGLAIHLEGTQAIVVATERHGVRRYVHLSALGTRAHSRTSYHRRKWLAEERVRASGLDYTILRPSVIFGERCDFLESLAAVVRVPGVTPMVGSGHARLQPLHVGDMAAVVRRCLEAPATIGGCYELGGPEAMSLDAMVTALEDTLGRRKPRLHVPLWLARLFASPAARPLMAAMLETLGTRVHPERRLNASHIELLAEDNVCTVSPEISDLCRTAFSAWLASLSKAPSAREVAGRVACPWASRRL